MLTEKQREYIKNANRRWNVKVGAVRSGKTYADYFTIPKRILKGGGGGLIILIGYTEATLERNIIEPMRQIWGGQAVGPVTSDSSVRLFGSEAKLLGASSASRASALQGCSIRYCYGDEVTAWNEQVFRMLQSRLDRADSVFDGTCNPSFPSHWFKHFLDTAQDLFLQHYTLDDNPALPEAFRENLKREYAGTVFYNRYILGRWAAAEGCVYRPFADNPEAFYIGPPPRPVPGRILCGVDFGGNRSASAFVAASVNETGEAGALPEVTVLASERHADGLDPAALESRLLGFAARIRELYGGAEAIYCDSAEPVLIRGLRRAFEAALPEIPIKAARKSPVNDRIRLTLALMAAGKLRLTRQAETLGGAFASAVWSEAEPDKRLDNFTSDIDSLDAFEYIVERIRR